uniref:Uncharacterized protein n=1 Tax=Ursus maritimus TaxID=29073 RepID=A0A452UXJ7_URSMA
MPTGPGQHGLPQGSHPSGCSALSPQHPTVMLCQAEAPVLAETLTVSASDLPCWLVKEFVVAEGTPCSHSQAKTTSTVVAQGMWKKSYAAHLRGMFKSCRSVLM